VFSLYAAFAGERVATLLAGRTRPDRDAPPGRVARAMLDALLDPAGRGSDDMSEPDGARPPRAARAGPFAQTLRSDDGLTALADLVLKGLFNAELELDAARSLTDEEHVEARIAAATTSLEHLVVQLRAAMLAGELSEDHTPEEDQGPCPS
jgi:hypothetical protein